MFNRITVNPQLPNRISKLSEISNNLWWSWNTDFLKIFKEIDIDLWERVDRNPVKFLKLVSQEKLEQCVAMIKEVKIVDLENNELIGNCGIMNINNIIKFIEPIPCTHIQMFITITYCRLYYYTIII